MPLRRRVTVRCRKYGSGKKSQTMLTVPSAIAAMVPLGTTFEVELVDDGILYRYIDEPVVDAYEETPAWITLANATGRIEAERRRGAGDGETIG
jgi:hypothetical protein